MNAMAEERDAFIEAHKADDPNLLSNVKYKVLTSLQNHWKWSERICRTPGSADG
jgi:hypothetical protein